MAQHDDMPNVWPMVPDGWTYEEMCEWAYEHECNGNLDELEALRVSTESRRAS